MKEDRSPSQIMFGFLPGQTADLDGRIWKVRDWRDPERLSVDEEGVRRRLIAAMGPWAANGRDNFASQELREGHSLEVVELNRSRGVSVEPWPNVLVCQVCKRIDNNRDQNCKCGKRRWSQLHFVGYHECGYVCEPWIPRCPQHDDVAINSPRTAQAKDLRFSCPTCGQETLKGLGAGRPCKGCGKPGIMYTVHRAANVYSSHSFTVATPAKQDQLQELNRLGGAALCLDWVVGGMPGDRPKAGAGTSNTLYEQLIAGGLSPTAAQAAVAAAEGAGHEFSATKSAAEALPAARLAESREEALEMAISVYNGRTTTKALAGATSNEITRRKFETDYPTEFESSGLAAVELVDRFPVMRGVFGYSRDSFSADSRLVMFRGKKGAYRVYGDRIETEALFLRLEPTLVARWLHQRGLLLRAPTDPTDARLAILSEAAIPQRGEQVTPATTGSAVLTLLHSLTHRLIRSAAVYAGIDRDALAEYLVPRHLAAFVYAGSRGDFVLGGLQAVFENNLDELLRVTRLSDIRCPLDPGCERAKGACPACLHLGEPSCSYYNQFLDRRVLVGPAGYWTSGR
ncbi:hypothetical protein BKG85_23085 [Mycobacteroides chelonae]|nr:hypothetical protein BKG85_23085 [Mycobacteroides chelonae]